MIYSSIDSSKKLLLVAGGNSFETYTYKYGPPRMKDYEKWILSTSPMSMAKIEKKCTHQHAIRGKCLTCGEENV